MNRLVAGVLTLALLSPAVRGLAQAPSISTMLPLAAAPGRAVDVKLTGANLAGASKLWTSFPATAVLAPGIDKNGADPASVVFRLTVPADAPPGIGAARVATGAGVSSLRLFMVDDLPCVADEPANISRDKAQGLKLPMAVDGAAVAEANHYYKFTAAAAQRVSVDVVGRRLGSKLDSVVRLLDAAGRELVYSDDEPSSGVDSRFSYKFPAAGDYFLEVRDIRYQGGAEFFYHLRVGDFPLPTAAFPLAVQKGSSAKVQLAGGDPGNDVVAVNMPTEVPGDRLSLSAAKAPGQGSSWVTLVAASGLEQMEQEPNNSPEASTPCVVPGALEGRFQVERDRDYFHFECKAGQRFLIRGQTRSLGSPSDLLLRLYKPDGSLMAEAEDSGPEEGIIDFNCPADGVYRLRVEELNQRGGPEYVYRIVIEPYRPGFSLSVADEKFDPPQNGVFVCKVTSARRGYTGPITLAIAGAGDGYVLANNVIPKDKNETTLSVTLPPSITAGQLLTMSIVGRARIGETDVESAASSLLALRKEFGGLPYPPTVIDGSLALGVGPIFPDFFKLGTGTPLVAVANSSGPIAFKVQATRLNKFDDKITLAVEGLPAGVTAKVPAIEKGQGEANLELTIPKPLAPGRYPFRVNGSAVFQNQPSRKIALSDIALQVGPSIQLAMQPAGALSLGGKQKIMLTFAGDMKPPAPRAGYQPNVTLAAEGPRSPAFAGFEPDNKALGLAGVHKAPKDNALTALVPALEAGDYSVELWVFNARDLNQPNPPALSGYIFSRPGAAGPGTPGDHLGIGGTSPDAPRDKLFLYNGHAVLSGKTPLALNAWHHVVLARAGEEVRLYLDGQVDAPEVQGNLPHNFDGHQLFFGTRSDDLAPLMGRLDEIAVFRSALTPAQVQAHFNAAKAPGSYRDAVLKDGPIAYWRLGETQGQVAENIAPAGDQRRVALAWKNLPKGVTAPAQVSLPVGKATVEVELAAAGDAAVGKFDKILVAATTNIAGEDVTAESPPAALEIAKP